MIPWPAPESPDWYWIEERAGILEYQNGMTREDAEKRALEEKATEDFKEVFGDSSPEMRGPE